ncbi:hypothetical protein Ancab_014601 [Ancistrocladus abbreviatus]
MACMKFGSKSEALHLEGQTWLSTTGLPSDVSIEIGEMTFQLHKYGDLTNYLQYSLLIKYASIASTKLHFNQFPLISRSGHLEKQIGECSTVDGSNCILKLDDIPSGAKAFELVAKFCYGIKFDLVAEFLKMTEEYGEGNLIAQTEAFINEVFGSRTDSMKALETCEEVLKQAEEVHVVSRCILSLAMEACSDSSLINWPVSNLNDAKSPKDKVSSNGILSGTESELVTDDWWGEDASFLSLPLYKRPTKEVEQCGKKPERIAGSLMFYARRYLPSMHRQFSFKKTNAGSSISTPGETDQRTLPEEIVGCFPSKRIVKNRYDLACQSILQREYGENGRNTIILDDFLSMQQGGSGASTPLIVKEGQSVEGSQSSVALTMVADLVDSHLAEVAPDVNLKLPKFQSLAAAIPEYARLRYDGIYHAIDIYPKVHPSLTESERELICRLMNCQKLSLEASTHATQNEQLPLRVAVQVVFEQLRLRTQISGWFFVSDNLEITNHTLENSAEDQTLGIVDDIRECVSELQKECLSMRQEIHKLTKKKRRWNILSKMFSQKKVHPRSFDEPKSNSDLEIPLSSAVKQLDPKDRKVAV